MAITVISEEGAPNSARRPEPWQKQPHSPDVRVSTAPALRDDSRSLSTSVPVQTTECFTIIFSPSFCLELVCKSQRCCRHFSPVSFPFLMWVPVHGVPRLLPPRLVLTLHILCIVASVTSRTTGRKLGILVSLSSQCSPQKNLHDLLGLASSRYSPCSHCRQRYGHLLPPNHVKLPRLRM